MNPIEQSILDALNELDSVVKQMPGIQPKPNLIPMFDRIDALARQLPRDANPDLSHYLAKKSYEKARLLLAGEDEKNSKGTCR